MRDKQHPWSSTDRLDEGNIPYRIHTDATNEFISGTVTCRALGFPPERVFKSILFLSHGKRRHRSIFLLPANRKIDPDKAAAVMGAPGRAASEEECRKYLRMPQGFFGPLCIPAHPIFVDQSARGQESILINSGTRGEYLELAPDALLKACVGAYADLSGGYSVERYAKNRALPLHTTVGDYQITGVQHVGPLEITYRGRERVTGREVTLCECFPDCFGYRAVRGVDGVTVRMLRYDNDLRMRLKPDPVESADLWELQECCYRHGQAMADLSFPAAPAILAVLKENQTTYTVAEQVEGELLSTCLCRSGQMDWDTVHGVLCPLVEQLASLGERKNSIRCIRPDTVLLRDAQKGAMLLTFHTPTDLIRRSAGMRFCDAYGYDPYMPGNRHHSGVSAMCAVIYHALLGNPPAWKCVNADVRSGEFRKLCSVGVPEQEAKLLLRSIHCPQE